MTANTHNPKAKVARGSRPCYIWLRDVNNRRNKPAAPLCPPAYKQPPAAVAPAQL